MITDKDLDTLYSIYKEANDICSNTICEECMIRNFMIMYKFERNRPDCTSAYLLIKYLGDSIETANLLRAINDEFSRICNSSNCSYEKCYIKRMKHCQFKDASKAKDLTCHYLFNADILYKEV